MMSVAAAATSFDRRAAHYDRHARVQRSAAAWLAAWLPPRIPETSLELGAGTGLFTAHLQPRVEELVATDISPEMVRAAARRVPGPRWMVCDADHPPHDRPYRAIFSCSLAQWLPDPARTFLRWQTVAAPGARLIAGWFVRGTMQSFFQTCPEASPFAWRSTDEWLDILATAGWTVQRHEVTTFTLEHENSAALLRDIHNLGAVVPRRLTPGRLRRALREHDAHHRETHGLTTPFVFLRVEAFNS